MTPPPLLVPPLPPLPPLRQVTEEILVHDLEDAWRLQDGTLGCMPAGLLDGLPPTSPRMYGKPGGLE